MGVPANRNDYVYWEDEYKLAFDDLSAEQRQFLVKLNNRLSEIEKGIREEGQALIDQLKKESGTPTTGWKILKSRAGYCFS